MSICNMKKIIILITLFAVIALHSQIKDTTIVNEGFTSHYSFVFKGPEYVTYTLDTRGKDKCDYWTYDFKEVSPRMATSSDFYKSGYDRGHLSPAENYDHICRPDLKAQASYYYNVSPQTPSLNRGMWKWLENEERRLSKNYKIGVVAGTIYSMNYIGDHVYVPSHHWKVIYNYDTGKVLFRRIYTNTTTPTEKDITIKSLIKKIGYTPEEFKKLK